MFAKKNLVAIIVLAGSTFATSPNLRSASEQQVETVESDRIVAGIIPDAHVKKVSCHSLCGFAKRNLGDEPWTCLEDCNECAGKEFANKDLVKKCFCDRQVTMEQYKDEAECMEGTKVFSGDFPAELLKYLS